jgi:hypothetical protein
MQFLLASGLRPFTSVVALSLLLLSSAWAQQTTPAVKTRLAENGAASLPIVVAADASPEVRAAAVSLARYLKRISGGEFQVEDKGAPLKLETRGIAVGTAA